MREQLNIIDTAMRNGVFQTFTRLLEGTPLEDELRGGKPYTLFAPVDIAFAYLPPETLQRLLKAEYQGILDHILGYHVVPGKLLSHQLMGLSNAKTMYGDLVQFSENDGLRIEGARLVHKDIEARNGVIHAIDCLLLPASVVESASA
jgi:uncharacterized surface protein with fasciclin (FAS1) repeats